jgi:hypothetical protein
MHFKWLDTAVLNTKCLLPFSSPFCSDKQPKPYTVFQTGWHTRIFRGADELFRRSPAGGSILVSTQDLSERRATIQICSRRRSFVSPYSYRVTRGLHPEGGSMYFRQCTKGPGSEEIPPHGRWEVAQQNSPSGHEPEAAKSSAGPSVRLRQLRFGAPMRTQSPATKLLRTVRFVCWQTWHIGYLRRDCRQRLYGRIWSGLVKRVRASTKKVSALPPSSLVSHSTH